MKKISFLLLYTCFSVLYCGIFYIIFHLNQVSGIDFTFKTSDLILLANLIFFFPALFITQRHRRRKNKENRLNHERKEYMRQNDIKVAQAQMQSGSEVWSTRNASDSLVFIVQNFFFYLTIFVFAILIDLIALFKKTLR